MIYLLANSRLKIFLIKNIKKRFCKYAYFNFIYNLCVTSNIKNFLLNKPTNHGVYIGGHRIRCGGGVLARVSHKPASPASTAGADCEAGSLCEAKKRRQPLIRCRRQGIGGGHRIRTCGCFHINGFQDRRFKPLSQSSMLQYYT